MGHLPADSQPREVDSVPGRASGSIPAVPLHPVTTRRQGLGAKMTCPARGRAALGLGDSMAARESLDEAPAIERAIDSPRDLLYVLQGYRDLALAAHRFEHAARLQGAVTGFAEQGRIDLWPDETQSLRAAAARLQASLEPAELDRYLAEGRSLERAAFYPLCSAE